MSTLTSTSTSESTIIKTSTVRLPVAQVPSPAPFIPQPYFAFQPLTTLLTLYVTGDKGELKPVVTTVTVPFYQQPLFHTKVARSLQNPASEYSAIQHTELAKLSVQTSREIELDTQHDMLLSSGLEEINDIESTSTSVLTEPLDSSMLLETSPQETNVKTLFKGPYTEIYERSATVNIASSADYENDKNPYGSGLRYNLRRLHQFDESDDSAGFKPQRDFTRIRRPTAPQRATEHVTSASRHVPTLPSRERDDDDNPFEEEPYTPHTEKNLAQRLPRPSYQDEPIQVERIYQNSQEITPQEPESITSHDESDINRTRQNGRKIVNPSGRRLRIVRPGTRLRNGHGVRRIVVTRTTTASKESSTYEPTETLQPVVHTTDSKDGDESEVTQSTSTNIEDSIEPSEASAEENAQNIITEKAQTAAEILPSRRKIIRRIRPSEGLGGRRPVIIRRTKIHHINGAPNTEVPSSISNEEPITTATTELSEGSSDLIVPPLPRRKVIRLRKPGQNGGNGKKKKIVITKTLPGSHYTNVLRGRGPADIHNQEGISDADSDYLQLPGRESSIQLGIYATQPIPITYFTTLTYYTTVLHGSDIDYSSSESVHSNVIPQTINSDIVNVIQTLKGYTIPPEGNSILHLGSRTLHGSTTVVNLASRIRLFNSNVYKGVFAPTSAPQGIITPKEAVNKIALQTIDISKLAQLPRTYLTVFTYSYTVFDGLSTKTSVNAETVTNVANDPQPLLTETFGGTINLEGVITLSPEIRTTNLGLRTVGGTTTEVNLSLKTLVRFDGIRNAEIQRNYATVSSDDGLRPTIQPSYGSATQHTSELSFLQPSYSSANELVESDVTTTKATPEIKSEIQHQQATPTFKRKVILTSVIQRPGGKLRQGIYTPRPGVRVVIRPISSKEGLAPSLIPDTITPLHTPVIPGFDTSTNEVRDESTFPIHSSLEHELEETITETIDDAQITEEVDENLDSETSGFLQPPRKRLTITVRRPYQGKISRTHTRFVLPSRFEITSRPSFYVVTRTGVGGVVKPSRKPFTVKIGRRKPQTTVQKPSPSSTVIYETYTTLTSVPVIFGLETSYRNVLLTASSAVTLPALSPHYDLQTTNIIPTHTVVLTYFTTTTFTIPFTVGQRTVFTTIEETNSRIVTQTFALPDSYDDVITTSSIEPTTTYDSTYYPLPVHTVSHEIESSRQDPITSIEFGVGGPTTHLVQPGKDGTTTRSIFYPLVSGAIPGTKVIIEGGDGLSITSKYGYVPEESSTTSPVPSIETTYKYPETSSSAIPDETTFFGISSPAYTTNYDTKTYFTTYTFFTTFFSGTDSIISSSEQVLTNVVTMTSSKPIETSTSIPLLTSSPQLSSLTEPSTVIETSEKVITSTSLSTNTFYATLFSDTSSFVTPIEEVSSEVFTFTETYTITRVISPTLPPPPISTTSVVPFAQTTSVVVTSTFFTTYTNFVTLFKDTDTVVSTMEDIVSNVVTLTLPKTVITAIAPTTTSSTSVIVPTSAPSAYPSISIYTITRTSLSTQTHYITLFSGDQTSLSSIEEVHTALITETIPLTISSPSTSKPTTTIESSTFIPAITSFVTTPFISTTTTEIITSSIITPDVPLVPTVRPVYTTYTYYTTIFSGTSPIVASQEEVSTSYVTFFVPDTSKPTSVSVSSVPTRSPTIIYLTTTDYSTYTFYTTFFSDDKPVVVSSTQLVPEVVVTAVTSTPSSIQPTPSIQSVLAFLSTHTFYTTYFRGTDVLVTSTESVITQYVTIESDSTVTHSSTVESTPLVPTSTPSVIGVSTAVQSSVSVGSHVEEIVNVVTAVESSVATVPLPDTVITQTVIEVATGSDVQSSVHVHTNVEVSSQVESKVFDISEEIFSSIATIVATESKVPDISEVIFSSVSTIIANASKSIDETPIVSYVTASSIEATPSLSTVAILTEIINGSAVIVYQDFGLSSYAPTKSVTMDNVTVPSQPRAVNISDGTTGVTQPETTTDVTTETGTDATVGSKPGLVFDLSDLLGGNTSLVGDNIGDAIKDIVSLITGKKNDTEKAKSNVTISTDEPVKTTPSFTTVLLPFNITESTSSFNDTLGTLMPVYRPPSDITIVSTITATASQPTEHGVKTVISLPSTSQSINTTTVLTSFVESTMSSISESSVTIILPSVVPPVFSSDLNATNSTTVTALSSIAVATNVVSGVKTIFLDTNIQKPPTSSISESTTSVSTVVEESTFVPSIRTSIVARTEEESVSSATPELSSNLGKVLDKETITSVVTGKTSIQTSVVTGIKTIFFSLPGIPVQAVPTGTTSTESSTKSATSSDISTKPLESQVIKDSSSVSGRSYESIPESFTAVTSKGQTILGKTKTGAKTIFFPDLQPTLGTTQVTIDSTKYITSVEPFTRTLAFVTTKVYYTRDSSLHITSLVTTTFPPRTFVSTIIGTKTILGILPTSSTTAPIITEPIDTTTKKIGFSLTHGIQTISASKTRDYDVTTSVSTATEERVEPNTEEAVYNIVPDSKPDVRNPRIKSDDRLATERPKGTEKSTERPQVTWKSNKEITCEPKCNSAHQETCQVVNGVGICHCKPGYAKKNGSSECEQIQTYVVLLRVVRRGERAVSFNKEFTNSQSKEYRNFAETARTGINKAYKGTRVGDELVATDVSGILSSAKLMNDNAGDGVVVNFTVQVSRDAQLNQAVLQEELARSLLESNYSVGGTDLYVSRLIQTVEDVQVGDFDECEDERFNDCSAGAVCINRPGSYVCQCKIGYEDSDPSQPGRVCLGELKDCEYCNARGDCFISGDGEKFCRCHSLYIGRKCEINGLILAISIPLAAAVIFFSVCCAFCCCKKRRATPKDNSNVMFRGIALRGPLSGTIDRKAIIPPDTSSESSAEHHHSKKHGYDGFLGETSDLTPKKSSKRSDLSLDRSLSTGYAMPAIAIPRAKQQHSPGNPKQVNYTVYRGQVYVW